MNSKTIAVIGARECDQEIWQTAEKLGRLLAKNGYKVICGGLGGVMEAVCKGVAAENGTSIGILPGDDSSSANDYVDIPVATGMFEPSFGLHLNPMVAGLAMGLSSVFVVANSLRLRRLHPVRLLSANDRPPMRSHTLDRAPDTKHPEQDKPREENNNVETKLKVTGMTCMHCVGAVKKALEAVEGVESADVSLEPGEAVVNGDADTDSLVAAVTEAGYSAEAQ